MTNSTFIQNLQRAHAFWVSKDPDERKDQSISTSDYDSLRIEQAMGYDEELQEPIWPDEAELERRRASGEYLEGLPLSAAIRKFHITWREAHKDAGLPWTLGRRKTPRDLNPPTDS